MSLDEDKLLELHRELVATPSISHQEALIADKVEGYLRDHGVHVERIGDNVVARAGCGHQLLYVSHLDTVPPAAGWTRDPWVPAVEDGKVHGLGANDAKAAVVAMIAALLDVAASGGPCELGLLLACEEETGGDGTEIAWPALRERGFEPSGVVVGEPTGLQIAVAQKGLLVLELIAAGDACHSANAVATGARNAVRALARDLVALEGLDLGAPHPFLGAATLEPTMIEAGKARNALPARASCILDGRTVPGGSHAHIVASARARIAGELRVVSDRLRPRECPVEAAVVRAAHLTRPDARLYGSPTMSDLVYFEDVPAIKVGPGQSVRSHTADEFVLESEILDGADFYQRLLVQFAAVAGDRGEPTP